MVAGSADELREMLRSEADAHDLGSPELQWLDDAVERVRNDRSTLATAFPAVGRKVGRRALTSASEPSVHDWTVDDAGRVLLLLAAGDGACQEISDLYRYGDAAERRAVLRSLPFLPDCDAGLALVADALRTNDSRLIAAAVSTFALERLDDDALNQAVLKCVFVGVPLDGMTGIIDRASPELSRMLADYVHERVAAGREVPQDLWPLVEAHPPLDVLAAIEAELDHPIAARREAGAAALAQRAEHTASHDARARP